MKSEQWFDLACDAIGTTVNILARTGKFFCETIIDVTSGEPQDKEKKKSSSCSSPDGEDS